MHVSNQNHQQQNDLARKKLRKAIYKLVQRQAKRFQARRDTSSPRRNTARRILIRDVKQKASGLSGFVDRLERIGARFAADIAAKQKLPSSAQFLRTAPAIRTLSQVSERITVLFVAANPIGAPMLRLDEEVRSLTRHLRQSEYRRSFLVEQCWATRPQDLLTALNEHRPTVLHFSGHGSMRSELALLDDDGYVKLISSSAIVHAIGHSESVRLVFFNACHSHALASAVVRHVDAAVGMNQAVDDRVARLFAAQFYSAISYGRSIANAFAQAKCRLMMEGIAEVDTPELFVAEGLDPGDITLMRRRDS